MSLNRRKTDFREGVSEEVEEPATEKLRSAYLDTDSRSLNILDGCKFLIFCLMLLVPIYAITISVIKHDWLMVAVDALLVPVGFVHGLLLMFGYIS